MTSSSGVAITVLLLLATLCCRCQQNRRSVDGDEDEAYHGQSDSSRDDTEGKGIEVAYSEMVALVLGRTLDVEVLLGLLEEVMLKAGYDLNFVSDSSGFVAGTVRVFARTRDTSEPIGVEELFRYFELVNDQLARLGVVAIIAIGHIVPPATEMRTVVAQLPHVILYPNTIDAVEGEVVLFTSLAIPGDSVGFNWKRQDGKSLPANSRIENYNVSSVLKITGVMPRDSGRYQLTATGSSGQVLVLTVNLKVTALDYRCEFNCGGNECIARKRVCDSYSDCSNGNDEITCDPRPYGRCFPKEFSCTGRCIDFPRVCDGTVDCDDQSDEAAALCLLAARTCQSDEFSCAQNQCVKRDWMCDGEYDCTGGSDEQNCGSIAPGSYCPSTHFQCRNHQCVPLAQFCDGSMHCLDGTDESICSEPVFSASLPVSSTFNVGESLSLVCEARGSPTPDITFLRDGEKLPCESRITMTSKAGIGRLVVRDFNSKDAGVYTCEARNMRGRRSSMAVVNFVDSVIEQCNDPDLTQGVPKRSVYYKVVPDPSGKACVDVVFLVDESGSMMDEHEWLKSTVPKLERRLSDISIGAGLLKNRYGLVGFGRELKNLALGPGAVIPVGTDSSGMGSDKELVVALEELRSDGVFEDGYAAIGMALDQLTFRSSCALQFILVTDEDRDIFNATTNYNYTLAWLRRAGATLNVVADQTFFNSDEKLLGINFRDNGFIQVAKTYTKMAGASVGKGYGSTFRDYVQMALATDGAAWDLNRLRRGGYTATAFAEAFININVEELETRLQRCLRCTCSETPTPTCRMTNILFNKCPVNVTIVLPTRTPVPVTPPQVAVDPNVITKDERKMAVFTCRVVIPGSINLPEELRIRWYFGGRKVQVGSEVMVTSDGRTLTVRNIRASYAGDYECRVSTSDGVFSDIGRLIVYVTPSIRTDPKVVTTCDGDKVTFRCITTGSPTPLVKWTRADGGLLPGGLGAAYYANTFEFVLTGAHDAGLYVCTAVNSAGQAKDSSLCRRFVSTLPPTTEAMSPATATIAETIEAKKPGTTQPSSIVTSQSPTRRSAERKPIFTTSLPITSSLKVGDTLRLVCEATGIPTPDIAFLKDGKKPPLKSRITIKSKAGVASGRLVLRDFTSKDAGVYTCEAKNALGRQTSVATVNFLEQCHDPDLLQNLPKGTEYHKIVSNPSRKACADVVFIVDESRSMKGEHNWLKSTVPKLEGELRGIGIGAGALKNRYGLVGFGHLILRPAFGLTSLIRVGTSSSQMESAKELVAALKELRLDGVLKDGYAAMAVALDKLKLRSACALHFILVTDKDRDIFNTTTNYNYMLGWLHSAGVTLNVVVAHKFFKDREKLLGMDSKGNGFAKVRETYTKKAWASVGHGYGNTFDDYVRMAFATDGTAWDLNRLRRRGSTATAFTDAFIDISVEDMQTQLQRCLRCTCADTPTPTCRVTNILPSECPG